MSAPESPGLVLVVDDEVRNRALLEELLTMRGFAVETAEDGETALALARERPPDVVLLDVMMPRMNGFDVCRRLKGDAATAAIPVLLVTSLDAREDRLAGIGAGANDFLTKPIDAADLLLRVRNAVLTKRLYDREAEQRRQLEALEAARDTLTHMIVHDIRSPLTGLHAYLGLLDRAAAEGALGDVLEFARDAHALTARIGELVSQVLDVSRLESGHMPLDLAQADLVALLRPAVVELGPPPEGVKVAYDVPDGPVNVRCDRDLMARVVTNLVGNAYKFTPKGGCVRLGVTTVDSRVRLEIDDTGPGVPRELRDRIFEKFGQGELGRAATRRSSGLGLTFCKLAVEAHGGAIGVDDAPGSGARFWIDLPAGSESA